MSPSRQRAKSLQWESDLGLQYDGRPIFPPANRRLRAKTRAMRFGVGDPYERLQTRYMDEAYEPCARIRSKSSDGRILDDLQAPKHMESPLRPNTEPATGRKGARKSRRESTEQQVCIRCRGINIDIICSKEGYLHSSMEDLRISARSCPLCNMLNTTPRRYKWTTRHPERYQLCVSFMSIELCPDSHVREAERTCLRLDVVYCKDGGYFDRDIHSRTFIAELVCFTMEHDPAVDAGIFWVRKLGANTASESSFRIAQEWLEQCIASDPKTYESYVWPPADLPGNTDPEVHEDHAWSETDIRLKTTIERLPPETPKRLIDLALYQLEAHKVQLTETCGLAFEYATLSYCWGFPHGGDWLTTRSNVGERAVALETDGMPKTILDSLLIASKLKIRYIWIDALCIVQDDPNDWAAESAKTAGIYHGSILTIVAASSSSASQGCFNSNSRSQFRRLRSVIKTTSVLEDGRQSSIYFHEPRDRPKQDLYKAKITSGPWALRGWTYQEQALTRRIIYYTDSQLLWECEHSLLTEDRFTTYGDRQPYPIMKLDETIRGPAVVAMWYNGVVEEYSRRKLTYESDNLVALSALAKATYLNKHVNYFAGIWKDSVLAGLLWHRIGPGSKARDHGCPSWSWASQDSGVSYGLAFRKENRKLPKSTVVGRRARRDSDAFDASLVDFLDVFDSKSTTYSSVKVVDVYTENDTLNRFGTVAGGYVVLETRTTAAWVLRDSFGLRENTNHMESRDSLSFWLETGYGDSSLVAQAIIFTIPSCSRPGHGFAHMDNDDNHVRGRVICALLATRDHCMIFILLKPVSFGVDTYKRVGIAMVSENELLGLHLDSATITII
jgi:hypothetical protein